MSETWEESFKSLVAGELECRRKRNAKYSMRKFAMDLGLSIAATSGLLSGKIRFSADRAAEVVERLNLRPLFKNRFLAMLNLPMRRKMEPIPADHDLLLTNWIYLAVLHFFDLKENPLTAAEIARRLVLKTSEVEEVIETLIAKGFLIREADGTLLKPEIFWAAGDGPPRETIRKHHIDNLNLAIRAVTEVPAEERQFSTITFCGDETQLAAAREQIMDLQQRLSATMEGSFPRTQVYRLSVALFPLNFQKDKAK